MKTTLSFLFVLISLASFAQNQTMTMKVGSSYSYIENVDVDFSDALGYFLAVGVQDKFTDIIGFSGEINFINQRTIYSLSIQSFNIIPSLDLYINERVYLTAGIESGLVTTVRSDGERKESNKELRFSYVGGASFRLNDRLDIQGRYLGAIDNQQMGFKFNLQLGISYRIPTGN